MLSVLISAFQQGQRIAVLSGGEVVDLFYDTDDGEKLASLYGGRIVQMNGPYGFVDIGRPRPAFLKLKPGQPVTSGAYVVVEITREPMEDRAEGEHGKASQVRLVTNAPKPEKIGLIKQTPASFISLFARDDLEIYVDEWTLLAKMKSLAPHQTFHHRPNVFEAFGLEEVWDSLFRPVVTLPGGGQILIETCSGLTFVDVNAGTHDPSSLNQQAVPLIFQQLRWRGLAGNIVIDFASLTARPQRDKVAALCRTELARWLPDATWMGWSSLGFLQLRRPLKRRPLWMQLTHACSTCDGLGRIS